MKRRQWPTSTKMAVWILSAGESWYEAPEWKKHRMREIPFANGYIDDFSNHPLDVNGDGYVDIVDLRLVQQENGLV